MLRLNMDFQDNLSQGVDGPGSNDPIRQESYADNSTTADSNNWLYEDTLASCTMEPPKFKIRTKDGKGMFQADIALVVGDPKSGKSSFMYSLLACISSGEGEFLVERPGKALVCNLEDPLESVVLPKIVVADGDPNQIKILNLENLPKGGSRLDGVLKLIEDQLIGNRDIDLVVFDTLASCAAKVDININSGTGVRKLLDPLSALAKKYGVPIILIHHFTKSSGSVEKRIGGSHQILGCVRSVWVAGHHPQDESLRCISRHSGNLAGCADGIVFKETQVDPEKVITRAQSLGITVSDKAFDKAVFSKIELVNEDVVDSNDLITPSGSKNTQAFQEQADLAEWAHDKIGKEGKIRANDLKAEATRRGISERNYRKARRILEKQDVIQIRKKDNGVVVFYLMIDKNKAKVSDDISPMHM